MSFGSAGRFSRRRESGPAGDRVYSTEIANQAFEPGTGEEFMARRSNVAPYSRNAFDTDAQAITFNKRPSRKPALVIALVICGIILSLIILAIVLLFVFGVFGLKSSEDAVGTTLAPSTLPTRPPHPTGPPWPVATSVPSFTIPTMIPPPPVEEFVRRNLMGNFLVLDQANPAYDHKSSVEYAQATQMLLTALKAVLRSSTLSSFLTDVSIASLENSGNNVLVQFGLSLYVPLNGGIDAAVVRNVMLSDLPRLEQELNSVRIDRDSLAVHQA